MESWVRQSPPAPRKVGRPEEAERPAPQRARILLEVLRVSWKEARSPRRVVKLGELEEVIFLD